MDSPHHRLWDWLWLLGWGLASSAWCVSAAHELGATFDEPGDVASGLQFWHTGSHAELLRLGAMPLPMDVCALPIYIYERINHVTVDLEHDSARTPIFLARTGTLVFWWLLLFYAWRAGTRLGGPWAGRLAVALIAVEPTLLAHACLATKDIAVSACLLAMIYHFRVGREETWWRRVGIPGIWFGIALLAKASAMAFAPLCMVAVELEHFFRKRACEGTTNLEGYDPAASDPPAGSRRPLAGLIRPFVRDSIQIGLLGVALTFLYCGSDWQPEPSWVTWAQSLPEDNRLRAPMVWLSEHVCIFHNAGSALVRQISHNFRGHDGAFLLGRAAPRFFWYYFPVALSIKLTIGLLVLPLALIAIQPRSLTNWACMAAGALLAYSVKCHVQIGVRLMLPLVVLGVVGIAAAVVRAWHTCRPGFPQHLLRGAAIAAVGWAAFSSIRAWPEALCYTNELYGGTDTGYLWLSDSNYDWGQGLPELADWQHKAGDAPLDVWYFGKDPAIDTLSMREVKLHVIAPSPDETCRLVRGRYLAASTTLLYGSYLQSHPAAEVAEFLRHRTPIGRTQTYLIYDFTK
jgi:hypothetical protein